MIRKQCKKCETINIITNIVCDNCISPFLGESEVFYLVKTARIDEIINFSDNYQSESTHDRKHIDKIIEMLENLKKGG